MITVDYKDLKLVANCMSKEEVRYYLCGINLRIKDKQAHLTATDGHRLSTLKVSIDHDTVRADTLLDIIIPASTIKSALKQECSFFTITGNSINANGVHIPFTPIDGTYPECDRVIPHTPPTTLIKLSKKLLKEYLAASSGKSITLGITGEYAPVFLACEETNGTSIIMPVGLLDTDKEQCQRQ